MSGTRRHLSDPPGMNQAVIVPGNADPDGFVELARTQKGRLFKKQILHMNSEFVHPNLPGKKIKVDENLAAALSKNFEKGYCDIVQVPIVDGKNAHVEDPLRNVGEVVGIEHDDKGIYAIIDARKEEYAEELGKTLIGASAMMHMDYVDTKTGDHVGPTLLHVAVTNRPYITNLGDFEEVVKLSADTLIDETPAILQDAADLQEEQMNKDELLAVLKSEHGIDVAALQAAANKDTTAELTAALSNVLKEAGVVSLSNADEDTIGIKDIAEAVVELSGEKVQLEKTVESLVKQADELRLTNATKEIEDYIKAGRILPKQKEAMIALSMEDRETFELLLPDEPLVSLSADGVTTHEATDSQKYSDETERLLKLANDLSTGK